MPLHSTPGMQEQERVFLCPIYERRTAVLTVQEREGPAASSGLSSKFCNATLETKRTVTSTIAYGAAAASNSERQEPQELLSAHG